MNFKKCIVNNEDIIRITDINIDEIIKETRKILKMCDKNNYKVVLIYNDKKIDEKYLKKDISENLRDIITIMHAINIKDKEERYNYIYDTVCYYLEN